MNRRKFMGAMGAVGCKVLSKGVSPYPHVCPAGVPDIRSTPQDLTPPPMVEEAPAPGKRTRQVLDVYKNTSIYHTVYLPEDWKPGAKYPVLVEYPGNGPWTSPCGDYSSGDVDGCNLGYGISAGRGFIWLALPFIDAAHQANQLWWWGDVSATIDYCREAVGEICDRFGGDKESVILSGFSRGAIACNFIGLHNDSIANLWLAFIASSHYDGVERWNWKGSDPASARERLNRLRGRATFVAQENSTQNIEDYICASGVTDPFTFQTLHFRNHTNTWVLHNIPERAALRKWVADILMQRPGFPAGRQSNA